MTNDKLRKMLTMAAGICEWVKLHQHNPDSIANDIISAKQQENIDELKEFIESIPETKKGDQPYGLFWANTFHQVIGAAIGDTRKLVDADF